MRSLNIIAAIWPRNIHQIFSLHVVIVNIDLRIFSGQVCQWVRKFSAFVDLDDTNFSFCWMKGMQYFSESWNYGQNTVNQLLLMRNLFSPLFTNPVQHRFYISIITMVKPEMLMWTWMEAQILAHANILRTCKMAGQRHH